MNELSVVILATNEEQRGMLQTQVQSTVSAKVVQAYAAAPASVSDPMLRRIEEAHADVFLVEIPQPSSTAAIQAIEILRSRFPQAAVFAVGDAQQPQVIIAAMRAGACEFLEFPTTTNSMLEAFVRLATSQRQTQPENRGKVFTFVNSKGGCGTTTMAVNTALSLQTLVGNVAIVDLAALGHVALHLNTRPSFTVLDAIRNLHRLDHALLATYMNTCEQGLELLAGTTELVLDDSVMAELPRLFDLLSSHYQYVVVDASTRLDQSLRLLCDLSDSVLLVATADVASLWSAAKVRQHLGKAGNDKLKLVINRFRKMPGFSEMEIEAVTKTKVFCKVPNQYLDISTAISRGMPVVLKNHSEVAHSFLELASLLSQREIEPRRKGFLLFGRN